jgi:hypothetical protein
VKLAPLPRPVLPGPPVPSLHRGWGPRVHRRWAACRPAPCHVPVPPSASPLACPAACASETILPPLRLRLTPAPLGHPRVASQGRAGGGVPPCLGAGCRGASGLTVRRETEGMPSGARAEWSSLRGGSPRVSPCPCWTKPLTHGGLYHMTTIQTCVRGPTHTPRGSTGCAGGCSVTACRSRCTGLSIRRDRGDRASPLPLGERHCTATGPKVSKTSSVHGPHPWRMRHCEGTDRSCPTWTALPSAAYSEGIRLPMDHEPPSLWSGGPTCCQESLGPPTFSALLSLHARP